MEWCEILGGQRRRPARLERHKRTTPSAKRVHPSFVRRGASDKKLPAWSGGVAAASADGAVDLKNPNSDSEFSILNFCKPNHPVRRSPATPPVQEGASDKKTPSLVRRVAAASAD